MNLFFYCFISLFNKTASRQLAVGELARTGLRKSANSPTRFFVCFSTFNRQKSYSSDLKTLLIVNKFRITIKTTLKNFVGELALCNKIKKRQLAYGLFKKN